MKTLLSAAGALLLAGFSLAYGSSFEIACPNPIQAGDMQLRPGAYWITHKGNEVIFTNVKTDERYDVAAMQATPAARDQADNVVIVNQNGVAHIMTVDLNGRHAADLSFGQ